uniref:MMS19 nucleotide excision repair protein n=1 Tax=Ursus americanus TaxID=9643 RepID=A0A452R385_URSAM
MAAAAALEAVAPTGALWGLVHDFVMGQQEGPADQVAADVKSGSYTVLQVVEALGSSLENPEPRTRARGIQLLSQVLLQCQSLLLEKEVVHLILFYENRLKDHHLVIPSVLQGLRALVSSPFFITYCVITYSSRKEPFSSEFCPCPLGVRLPSAEEQMLKCGTKLVSANFCF